MQKIYSNFLSLSQREWLKGLWLALVGAFVAYLYSVAKGIFVLPNWELNDLYLALINYTPMVKALIGTAFTYWTGTALTNSNGQVLKKEQK